MKREREQGPHTQQAATQPAEYCVAKACIGMTSAVKKENWSIHIDKMAR